MTIGALKPDLPDLAGLEPAALNIQIQRSQGLTDQSYVVVESFNNSALCFQSTQDFVQGCGVVVLMAILSASQSIRAYGSRL